MGAFFGNRRWKVRGTKAGPDSELERNFESRIRELHEKTGLSPVTLRVCLQRGLETAEEISTYLTPKLDQLTDPHKIKDMNEAVERLVLAKKQGEKVRVFGDYDVDGTCGAALLTWIFKELGISSDAVQPDRFKDGYGLNVKAVEAAREAAQVLITVDCGITSFEPIRRARELALDVIVVDHHQIDPVKGLPDALAVIDPQRADCPSGLKQLCGCGLAFYLAMALRARWRKEGWFEAGKEPNLKAHLDLVVIATAADQVPLTGDNRILVRHGLEVLRNSKKPGVRALMEVAGLGSRTLSPGHLGFTLGPRINASGRMDSASIALEMLTTSDAARGLALALQLEQLNKERSEVQNRIWDEIRLQVEKAIAAGHFKHGILVADPGWHEGVVGIVASRVTETFHRPAAVVALREDLGKGSVRSFGGKDVLAAIRACSDLLLGFGGHRHAAGFSVGLGQVEELARRFDEALATIPREYEQDILLVEGECTVSDLNIKTLEELESLGPFGTGNPEPVFTMRASVQSTRVIKERHLKLQLQECDVQAVSNGSRALEALWFNIAERVDPSELMDGHGEWAGVPELNRFRGQVTPQLRVKDFRKQP